MRAQFFPHDVNWNEKKPDNVDYVRILIVDARAVRIVVITAFSARNNRQADLGQVLQKIYLSKSQVHQKY